MDILFLLILGLVQGLTEFLPVSSSGHLVLLGKIFGIEDSLFVSIILHVATLAAVLIVLRKEVMAILKNPFGKDGMNLIIATIPTCLIVLVIMPILSQAFEGAILPFSFAACGLVLLLTEIKAKKIKVKGGDFSSKSAFKMGIAQGFAILPGISRSGSTICAGILCGEDKEKVSKFSFLMSIPIILLSLLMEILNLVISKEKICVNVTGLVLAALVSFLVGIISIKFMMKLTKRVSFKYFIIYLFLIAIVAFFV